MTIVSNDPTWWPSINAYHFASYFGVATFVGVMYDWALTFGQEVKLIWVCYLGILSAVQSSDHLTDRYMVGVVLCQLLSPLMAACYATKDWSDSHNVNDASLRRINYTGDTLVPDSATWILYIVWEVLTLCLTVWIVVKHFHELRLHPAKGIIRDCFMILIKTLVLYFVRVGHDSFVAVSCFQLFMDFSSTSSNSQFLLGPLSGLFQILEVVQMFVLGPWLILGIQEYNAKLVADSNAATSMTSITFQEHVHISTSSMLAGSVRKFFVFIPSLVAVLK
ncbi:hypothetical protein BDR06DRAFT_976166 [Suillus hirtellus]|nr:hypothetical protein BDR06DRAFT_976166 [Suillus hirtellus]